MLFRSRRALHQVACSLCLPLSRVYGVASFYHLFRRQPAAAHRIAVCFGTACFINGAPLLRAQLAELLGLPGSHGQRSGCGLAGDRNRSGDWELVVSGCLSACGQSPVLQLDGAQALAMPLAGQGSRSPLHTWLSGQGLPAPQSLGEAR